VEAVTFASADPPPLHQAGQQQLVIYIYGIAKTVASPATLGLSVGPGAG
jgi:hypothetical protein